MKFEKILLSTHLIALVRRQCPLAGMADRAAASGCNGVDIEPSMMCMAAWCGKQLFVREPALGRKQDAARMLVFMMSGGLLGEKGEL